MKIGQLNIFAFVWSANIASKSREDIIMFRTQNCMWDLKCTYFVFIETIGLGFPKEGRKLGNVVNSI